MKTRSIMQQALNNQWEQLPQPLRNHYQAGNNIDMGVLSIEYPRYMQWPLNLLRIIGVLINRQGKDIPTTVEKTMRDERQYWKRQIQFTPQSGVLFKTVWQYDQGNELIEYVNRFIGLRMAVRVQDEILYYEGKDYLLRLGKVKVSIPEWMLLGHTSIQEKAIDNNHFEMDFRLHHPVFGQIYRYSGTFNTEQRSFG